MESQKIWSNILSAIKSQVSASTFKTWFAGSVALDYRKKKSSNLLIIGLKNSFLKSQIESRYLPTIRQTTTKLGLAKTEFFFVVNKTAKTSITRSQKEPLFSGIAPTYLGTTQTNGLNPNHTLQNFVVGSSNNLAYLALQQVASNLGRLYNPLFVYGPTGVGKTHLLQACGNEIISQVINARVAYATAEKFTNDYLEALANKTMTAFRQKYRGLDLLLVDDVQFLAGKESTQEEFFHTFCELHLLQKQIIVAADRHPQELGKLKERLVSRFLGGMTVDIGRPDLELRIAILKAKCKEKGLALNDEVIYYLAQSYDRSVRELEGVLVQVLALTKLASGRVSLEEIQKNIEGNRTRSSVKPTPEEIISAVCHHFRVTDSDLCGPKRKAGLVWPRYILIYLLRQELGLSLENIGQLVGGRDHSSILYALEKVARLIASNQDKKDDLWRARAGFKQ